MPARHVGRTTTQIINSLCSLSKTNVHTSCGPFGKLLVKVPKVLSLILRSHGQLSSPRINSASAKTALAAGLGQSQDNHALRDAGTLTFFFLSTLGFPELVPSISKSHVCLGHLCLVLGEFGYRVDSLPELPDFNLCGKTILAVQMNSSGCFDQSTQEVSFEVTGFSSVLVIYQ